MPWVHLYVDTNGLVKACCNANITFGDLRTQTLEEIWNGAAIRKFRLSLKSGVRDKRCLSCYQKDDAGKSSMRTETLAKFDRHSKWVDATSSDGTSGLARPVFLDIRFNNLCNLSCRTCWHGASSSWFEEAKVLKNNVGDRAIIAGIPDPTALFEQLTSDTIQLEEIYFAGGEPLMMQEHYDALNHLISKRQTAVRLRYNTNLSLLALKGQDVIEMWAHFDEVTVSASVDGLGLASEYIRKGLKWSVLVQNMRRIKAELAHVKLEIAPTVSVFNVLDLPALHRFFVAERLIGVEDIYLNMLARPNHYNVKILPASLKDQATSLIEAHLSWLEQEGAGKQLVEEFQSLITYMRQDDWSHHLPVFRKNIRLLDAMRGESFEQRFPPDFTKALGLF